MTGREGRALRRRRVATMTGVVAAAALGLRAAATLARQRTRGQAPRPRQRVRTLAPPPPSLPQPAAHTTWEPPPPTQLVRRRGRQSATATAVAIVFAIGGAAVIGVAIASQRPAPAAPALSAVIVDSPQPLSTSPAPSPQRPESWRRAAMAAVQPSPARAVRENAAPHAPAREAVTSHRSLPLAPSKPVSVTIPAIGVRSVVRHLGQAANGSLEVPSGAQYNDAAWYRYSPPPGSLGPAVILGHVDSAAQGPSVFFRLGELRPGHRVTVTRADGSAAVFVVDDVRRYAKKNFPTKLVYSDIDHAGLRILTCGGAFDDAAGSYLDNIVVFASLVGSKS